MKDEITLPDHSPDLKEEKLKAADKRKEKYSLVRDLKAKDNNEAITRRLAKEEKSKGEDKK